MKAKKILFKNYFVYLCDSKARRWANPDCIWNIGKWPSVWFGCFGKM